MKILKKAAALLTASVSGLALTANFPMNAGAASGVVINEVCAKNTVYAADDGKFYDWIELYNASDDKVDLSGYGISDNAEDPYRFTFPDGTELEGKKMLMVFCDSKINEAAGKYTAAFGLSTDGETLTLTDPSGNITDTVTFEKINTNVSYGRITDGSEQLGFMEMTPNAPNMEKNQIIEVQPPVFSQKSGFYDNSFELSITAPQNTSIYYTLDGSTPTDKSNKYTSPITVSDVSSSPNVLSARTDIAPQSWMGGGATAPKEPVDKAFIIRAAAIDSDGNISKTATGTYFIGFQNKASYYKNMNVISLVTDFDNLYDNEKGIYILGKVYDDWKNGPEYNPAKQEWEIPANYTQKGAEWEREASMQIFSNGELALDQNVGIRIHGGATRTAPQKSFNVYARSDYGNSKIDFDLYNGSVSSESTGETLTKFDSFILRNGGNDGHYTRFRDKLDQTLVSDRNILTQGMEPSIVFIDGEYWGHYEVTEKLDEDFVSAHYGVKKKNICIVKNEELDAGDAETYEEWKELWNWIKSSDMSNEANYEELCGKIDMQSFMDYISAEIYYNNSDWGENNMAMWKSSKVKEDDPYADGKWRFILFDTEYSSNLYGQGNAQTNTFDKIMREKGFITDLINAAMKSKTFRENFSTTFMDIANENFDYQKISSLISQFSESYRDFTVDTLDRFWPSSGGFGGGWGPGIGPGFGPGFGDWGWGNTDPGEDPGSNQDTGSNSATASNWQNEINTVNEFYKNRFAPITEALKRACGLNGNMVNITVRNETSKGNVKVNTLSPDFAGGSWSGKYYTDNPVHLKAEAVPGNKFVCWETSDGKKITGAEAEISFDSDMTITAVYEKYDGLLGDVNLDGQVNTADAVMLQKWLVKKGDITGPENANVHSDAAIDVFDIIALLRIIRG